MGYKSKNIREAVKDTGQKICESNPSWGSYR